MHAIMTASDYFIHHGHTLPIPPTLEPSAKVEKHWEIERDDRRLEWLKAQHASHDSAFWGIDFADTWEGQELGRIQAQGWDS